MKLSEDGIYQWDRVFATNYLSYVNVVALESRRIALCGELHPSIDFGGGDIPATGLSDNFVAVFDSVSGSHVWSKALSTTGEEDGGFVEIAAAGDDVIVAGSFQGTATLGGSALTAVGVADMYLARYRGSDGNHVWSTRHGRDGARTNTNSIASDGTRFFVGGSFIGTTNLGGDNILGQTTTRHGFTAAYDSSNASHIWSMGLGGDGYSDVTSLAANPTKLAISVAFREKINIGTHTFDSGLDHIDVAIARLSPSTGAPGVAATQFGSTTPSIANPQVIAEMSLAYGVDKLAGAGWFAGSTKLLETPLSSAGGADIAAFQIEF